MNPGKDINIKIKIHKNQINFVRTMLLSWKHLLTKVLQGNIKIESKL
jgi:hypothetical protein